MQDNFCDVLMSGDVEKARELAKRQHPTPEELEKVLFGVACTMPDTDSVVKVLHFLRGEMSANMLATYGKNKESALHIAARLKRLEVMAALIFTGIPHTTLDGNGKTAISYLDAAEAAYLSRLAQVANQYMGPHVEKVVRAREAAAKSNARLKQASASARGATKLKGGFFNPVTPPKVLKKEEVINKEKEEAVNALQESWKNLIDNFSRSVHVTYSQVEALIKQGANVNACDQCQKTMLHWAVEKGYEAIVDLLAKNGADWDANDMYGQTPRQLRDQKSEKSPYESGPVQFGAK